MCTNEERGGSEQVKVYFYFLLFPLLFDPFLPFPLAFFFSLSGLDVRVLYTYTMAGLTHTHTRFKRSSSSAGETALLALCNQPPLGSPSPIHILLPLIQLPTATRGMILFCFVFSFGPLFLFVHNTLVYDRYTTWSRSSKLLLSQMLERGNKKKGGNVKGRVTTFYLYK